MSKANGAPLTRAEFLESMEGINKRFDGIDKRLDKIDNVLALIVEALKIQDRQISERKPVGVAASRGQPK